MLRWEGRNGMRTLAGWLVLLAIGCAQLGAQAADSVAARIAELAPRHGEGVRAFYAERANAAAWVDARAVTPGGRQLATALDTIDRHGLDPRRYDVRRVRRLLDRTEPESLAALDVALTVAFLRAGHDLAEGRVRPESIDTMWTGQRGAVDVEAALRVATAADGGPAPALAALAPPHAGYRALRTVLPRFQLLAASGGGPAVGPGPTVALGDSGGRVAALRTRLAIAGDLRVVAGRVCDTACDAAVRRFQERHGLVVDGRVGSRTRAALDAGPEGWARVIALNLERWRWVPRELGDAPLFVNSAAFAATRTDASGAQWHSAVIVGRPEWPTPIVSGQLSGIVFAPRWNVPRAIAALEILPAARRDTLDLAAAGFCLVDSLDAPIAADSLSWEAAADSMSGVRLVQAPGPGNPLGGVKLVFANRFNVSLHGSPERGLFARPVRALSHGCVRMERAAELATLLVDGRGEWVADSVARAVADTVERMVPVVDGPMVVLGYWTAWVTRDGSVQFRPDVYGWDAKLARALAR